MTGILKNQIERIEYRDSRIFWSLFIIFTILVVSYGFLINSTILNAVAKQNMEKTMMTLSSEVNSLEFQYLNIKNGITLNFAKSKGFVSLSTNNFASLDLAKRNVSLSINEN